jgi:hypothetical protein
LVIFAGLVLYDFQRLRVTNEIDSAPLLAASIFRSLRSESQLTAQTAHGRRAEPDDRKKNP